MSALSRSAHLERPKTQLECAWAAGLFEGEGTVTIGRRGQDDTYRLVVMVGNTDRDVCAFFFDRWHGWLQDSKKKSQPNRKPSFQWIATADTAKAFLHDISPHVVTARVRTKIALALVFRDHQTTSSRRNTRPDYKPRQRELYAAMRKLNARGLKP